MTRASGASPTAARFLATLRMATLGTTTSTRSAPATAPQSLVTQTCGGNGRAPGTGVRLRRDSRMAAASFSK